MSAGRLTPPVGDDDHTRGPGSAAITLVEYGDFECPYCGMAFPILKGVQRSLGSRLRFVFRNFPLKRTHLHAQHAAEAAESAGAQLKYWQMHAVLFENQHALEDADLVRYARAIGVDADRLGRDLEEGTFASKVRTDFRSGVRSGVNGTPTFFVNGERYDGRWEDEGAFTRALVALADSGRRTGASPM